MLILTRRLGEETTLNVIQPGQVKVMVLGIYGRQVRLGFTGGLEEVKIHRLHETELCCDEALIRFPYPANRTYQLFIVGACQLCGKVYVVHTGRHQRVEVSDLTFIQLLEYAGLGLEITDRGVIKEHLSDYAAKIKQRWPTIQAKVVPAMAQLLVLVETPAA